MSERLPKHLDDAVHAAGLALRFVSGLGPAEYAASELVTSAVERQVEIVGEACRRALEDSPALEARLPDCRQAIAMRNRIAHGYDTVDHAIVLGTVTTCFPQLIDVMRQVLAEMGAGDS